jgi:hypothetical protein
MGQGPLRNSGAVVMTVIGHYEPPPRKRPLAHRPSRKSQCGRILTCLEHGGWWTTRQLLQEVPAITHSRISELRNTWGYTIEHRTTGPGAGGSEYRLTTLREEAAQPGFSARVDPPVASSRSAVDPKDAAVLVGAQEGPNSRPSTPGRPGQVFTSLAPVLLPGQLSF